ncbi:MAG: type II secretion system protein [Phycisphaerae bacterium]
MKTTRRGGFSLAELMIAIGIMGVGITLVATIFPTALKQNEFSNNDTMGTLIAENGLAMAQALVTKSFMNTTYPPSTPDTLHVIADEEPNHCAAPYPIDANQQHYPTFPLADPNAAYAPYQGYVVLGRKASTDANANDYQLVVVSYAKRAGGIVKAESVDASILGSNKLNITNNMAAVKVGTPIIMKANGAYATVTDANASASEVTLDRAMPGGAAGPAYVIVEEVSGNNAAKSPAIGTAVIETQLRP